MRPGKIVDLFILLKRLNFIFHIVKKPFYIFDNFLRFITFVKNTNCTHTKEIFLV